MRKYLLIALLALGIIPLTKAQEQESDPAPAREPLALDWIQPFTSVSIKGPVKVEFVRLSEGGVSRVSYLSAGGPERKVNAKVDKNGLLRIREKRTKDQVDSTRITIHYTSLDGVELRGASAHFTGTIEDAMFDLTLLDGARAQALLDVKDLLLRVEGRSELTLRGRTRYLTLNTSGATRVDASSLQTMAAYVKAESRAWVWVDVTERLEAYVSSSKVRYGGYPQWVRGETLMGGALIAIPVEE